MKQLLMVLTVAILAMSMVSASDSYISDDVTAMAYEEVKVVQYCVTDADPLGEDPDIDVVVDAVCRDLNGVNGCQAADTDMIGSTLFTVVPSPNVMKNNECVDLILTTNITDPAQGGNFFYTVNGEVGGASIGTEETGLVQVPEFGILAAFGVLGLAGLFVYRKRH